MAAIHSDAFNRDAVRIALTSGLTRRQVASDLGIGFSTLNKWVKAVADEAGPPDPEQTLLRENERLRRENRILKDLSRARKQSGRLFSDPPHYFKSLKAELVWRRSWQTRRDVEIALFEYINGFYNPRRRHSDLGWKSPVAFERKAA